MEASPPPQSRVEVEGSLPDGLATWKAVLVGPAVPYVLLVAVLGMALTREPTLSSWTVFALFLAGILGTLFGYHVAGQATRRLERENDRLTAEVHRIADERPHSQGLVRPLSSNSVARTED